jgi:hypothetical protein
MIIERFKSIAAYLSEKTGLSISENAARKWAARSDDPLPVRRVLGRAVARMVELDAWIERRMNDGERSRRRRSGL